MLTLEVPFRNPGRGLADLSRLLPELPETAQRRLEVILRGCADPDGAVHYLSSLRAEQPSAFHRMMRAPNALQFLVAVFSHSRFLSEDVLRNPEWLESLPQSGDLYRVISAEEYEQRIEARIARFPLDLNIAPELSAFRHEQILRILVRDLLGYGDLADITEELSNLADAILHCSYQRIHRILATRFGVPRDEAGAPIGLSIMALGKLGARELNYSSDIDLMFIHGSNGETSGPEAIPAKDFFKRLCVRLTELLSAMTPHGACYRVDLRLRPEGTLGEVSLSLDAARHYYQHRARDWELQMLIKARVAAGDRGPGRDLLTFVEPLTYSSSLDFSKVEAVSEARIRIHEKLARRRGLKKETDIKLMPGGIRDIEFLVQCLQRLHGGREHWVRHGSTLMALFRLGDKKLLTEAEFGRLSHAYRFFRNLEHRLQFLEDRQTHTLPSSPEELELLARRMPPAQLGSDFSAGHLMAVIHEYAGQVKEIYERVVHTQLPLHYTQDDADRAPGQKGVIPTQLAAPGPDDTLGKTLERTLLQRAPNLASTVERTRIRHGRQRLETYLDGVLTDPERLAWLDGDAALSSYVVDLFEHSPFLSEHLNRKPELLDELRRIREAPRAAPRYAEVAAGISDAVELRRFYNREMFRIQCESLCLRTPVFDTLLLTSELADSVLAAAYGMALEQARRAQPPESPAYEPRNQMVVIALGRLGMLEFDLGSDADLVFVLPDQDAAENFFWTRVAERMVELLMAYTGDGTLFSVDTRLRPNGREGPLVQSESTIKLYFENTAEAWEGIAYMKSRAVAGNIDRGTAFLEELQEVDWRRWGQGGRSRSKLRQMRQRLEAEQGASNPLKAGKGGFHDVDFALLYLRLKGAGIFYKALNTPRRIGVLEKMGHLDRAEAKFLLDAATLFRAVDHGMRLMSGHAAGKLPSAQAQIEILTDLVGRWTPDHLHDQPIADELAQVQDRTRDYFNRLFS